MCDIESKQERKEKNRIEKKRKKKGKCKTEQDKTKQGLRQPIFFFLSAIVKSYQVQRTSIVKECCFKAKKRKALQQQQ